MGTSSAGGYQYGYTNPIVEVGADGSSVDGVLPDGVVVTEATPVTTSAAFTAAIDSVDTASMDDVNPAYATSVDNSKQSLGVSPSSQDPRPFSVGVEARGAEDLDNPVTNLSKGIQESDLKGEGLGDYVAGGRPSSLAHPSH